AAAARMLRELADAFDVLTKTRPLVFVLEDLHWSDTATLAWIDAVARRRDPARLLLLATYRPAEAIVHGGALRRLVGELRDRPHVAELLLDYLSSDAVRAYVSERCGAVPRLDEVAGILHERSHGLPLFLVTIVEELMRRGILRGGGRPDLVFGDSQIGERSALQPRMNGLAGRPIERNAWKRNGDRVVPISPPRVRRNVFCAAYNCRTLAWLASR
ncbi:MAG: hypothetical protein ACREQ9_14370, partial [Candidatus Binatia bacterium]